MGFRVSAPAPQAGYNRVTDWPTAGGVPANTSKGGGLMGGLKGLFSAPIESPASGTWHPTVLWMFGFIVVEMVAFHALSRFLNL